MATLTCGDPTTQLAVIRRKTRELKTMSTAVTGVEIAMDMAFRSLEIVRLWTELDIWFTEGYAGPDHWGLM